MAREPLAFQELLDAELRFRTLPAEAQKYFFEHRETMPDSEFWEFYEWLTAKQEPARPDPYAWDLEELDGIDDVRGLVHRRE